jgi:hypothetical protein
VRDAVIDFTRIGALLDGCARPAFVVGGAVEDVVALAGALREALAVQWPALVEIVVG